MVWRPFVPTTDRSMILATRGRSEGLDEKRPITEALQLHFDMGALCFCLMCSSPERPGDDELWSDAFARKARRDAADFLHRPADQWSCDFNGAGFVAALWRILFGGDRLVASATAFA